MDLKSVAYPNNNLLFFLILYQHDFCLSDFSNEYIIAIRFFKCFIGNNNIGSGESGAMKILNYVFTNVGLNDINLVLNYVEAVEV